MAEIFSDEIIGNGAITSGGYPIGVVEDVVIDTDTGEIRYLLIKPAEGTAAATRTDSKGRAVIPIGSIKIAEGKVIVF